MNSQPATITTSEAPTSEVQAPATAAAQPKSYVRLGAILGFVLTLVAWGTLMINEWVSLIFCLLGMAGCIVGCLQPRSNLRNLAITGIVAAAVLLLDLLLLVGIICYLKSM